MVQIAPSILSADFAHLEQDCRKVLFPDNNLLHFDVMDGVFVGNITAGAPVLTSLVKAIPEAYYDVHLMIVRPDKYLEDFSKAGADTITVHYEAESPPRQVLRAIRALGLKAGISLRPVTPMEEIFPLLEECDQVLIMSVEPGFGGQTFMPEAPGRIRQLKDEITRQNLDILIEVDGGINAETAPLCIEAGADILVAGNAVFGAADPGAMVRRLKGDS